jgi:hypothetical protein
VTAGFFCGLILFGFSGLTEMIQQNPEHPPQGFRRPPQELIAHGERGLRFRGRPLKGFI